LSGCHCSRPARAHLVACRALALGAHLSQTAAYHAAAHRSTL